MLNKLSIRNENTGSVELTRCRIGARYFKKLTEVDYHVLSENSAMLEVEA
jgi:hypothetical protein